jgi:5-methylcytosine-specific restriction endonuclease McrA
MREKVEARAGRRCEYCQAPQDICACTFHLDHIVPRSKDGSDSLANYALACFPCNDAKAAHTSGTDPKTRLETPLFHPRRQHWAEHSAWTADSSEVRGLIPTGRATVARLKMNEPDSVEARTLWAVTEIRP